MAFGCIAGKDRTGWDLDVCTYCSSTAQAAQAPKTPQGLLACLVLLALGVSDEDAPFIRARSHALVYDVLSFEASECRPSPRTLQISSQVESRGSTMGRTSPDL